MPFVPGGPWPGTAGGAASPAWGGYVRLFVRAAIAAGNVMHAGPHTYDRLDAGNVLGGGTPAERAAGDRLWIDLACDALDVELIGGAAASQGILSRPDAATCTVNLFDPDRKYDPLNPDSPYTSGTVSRLVPGTPVEVFAEVIDDPAATPATVTRYDLFTGTADTWGEDWTPTPHDRRAQLVASDATKRWAKFDRPEQPPAGAGDTTAQRVARLVSYFGWLDPVAAGTSTVTLAATTLAQTGWELLNRTLDDELGVVYFAPDGTLTWYGRGVWDDDGPPVVTVGCRSVDPAAHDVLVDATPSNVDTQLRNSIWAARPGGIAQHVTSTASTNRYATYEYKRTDLGLADDVQVGAWASFVLAAYAFPQVRLENVTMLPAVSGRSWAAWGDVLPVVWWADTVRVLWAPPDRPEDEPVEALARVVGTKHAISHGGWEIVWQLVHTRPLDAAGVIMHVGPHAQDRLNAGFILG